MPIRGVAQPVLLNAHAHNDYQQNRPLHDALENGFFSIEVDIWRSENEIYVAHNRSGIRKGRTLKAMYFEPLRKRVAANDGRMYPDGPLEFVVMIDLKGDWGKADLEFLSEYLRDYRDLMTVRENGRVSRGAIRVLLSGNSGKYEAASMEPGCFSIDGGIGDIESEYGPEELPRTSANYRKKFRWKGIGRQPADERDRMEMLAAQADSIGRELRFWATPDRSKVWKVLLDAGVDWINVDRLGRFRRFMETYQAQD